MDYRLPKLGKQPARFDPRTLKLAKYASSLPPAPASTNWIPSDIANWGEMDNDQIGDCTCAAAGHLIMEWTDLTSKPVVPADSDILAAYKAITGYDGTPQTDQGANELDVLNYWRQVGIAGHQINSYAGLDVKDLEEVKSAINLFGGIYIGVALPISAQTQIVWDTVSTVRRWFGGSNTDPGSWGGHAVPIIAYDAKYLYCITWGGVTKLTWSFWKEYVDEAYAIVTPDFIKADNTSPSGLDLFTLQKDLESCVNG